MTKRRKLTTAFKKAVTLAALRGDKTIQDISAHYQVPPCSPSAIVGQV